MKVNLVPIILPDIHFSLCISRVAWVFPSGCIGGVARSSLFSSCSTPLEKKKISSQSEWWWWGFQDVIGCSARRGHQEPKPIMQRKKFGIYEPRSQQRVKSSGQARTWLSWQRFTSTHLQKFLSLTSPWQDSSLWRALPLLFILHIFQLKLWIWLRKIFSLLA